MISIVNLTPHPVTIIRAGREPVTYPACAPEALPRAIETPMTHTGCMELSVSGDTQDAYENHWSMVHTGVVDFVGYFGVDGLPELSATDRAFGCTQFRIVSIVTAIGALAAGRPIVDLLVPMGQVRDATTGRIIGASGTAPASALLTPLAERLIGMGRSSVDYLRAQLDEARAQLAEVRGGALERLRSELAEARRTIADRDATIHLVAAGSPFLLGRL